VEDNNRPDAAVQQCCHSAAVSADVDVLSPVLPTPSVVVRAPSPALLSPHRSTLAAAAAQFEPVPCLPPVGRTTAEVAAAPSLNILCAVEPPYAAFLHLYSVTLAPPVSTERNEINTSHFIHTYSAQWSIKPFIYVNTTVKRLSLLPSVGW